MKEKNPIVFTVLVIYMIVAGFALLLAFLTIMSASISAVFDVPINKAMDYSIILLIAIGIYVYNHDKKDA